MDGARDDVAIAIDDVSYFYGKGALSKQILFGVSDEVREGEILILTGPSGSGKTTLLTLMGALRAGQSGSTRILGQELRDAKENALVAVRRQIGYIFQSHNLLQALSVEQNVRMATQLSALRKLSRRDQRERIEEVLDRVGMVEHIDKRVSQLSGGQRQRVAIARALVNRPKIILADEPTASLDKQSGRDVVDLIQQLAQEEGACVVLVTHDNRILDVADRILHLEDGKVKPLRDAVASDAGRMLHILSEQDPEAHAHLLTFAVALARVAHADREVSDSEIEVIRRVLNETAGLGEGEVEFVIQLALAQPASHHADQGGATGTSQLASLRPEHARELAVALEAVAEADGELTPDERGEIDRILAEIEGRR
jgi:putative ABC transport system ATP-binding protein